GLLSGLLLLFVLLWKPPFRWRWLPGFNIFLLMFWLGVLTVQSNCQLPTVNCQLRTADCQLFSAEILEPPRHTSKTVKLIVSRYDLDTNANTLIREGKALLFLEKDSNSLALQFGDWIIGSTSLKSLKNGANPYAFDPAGYYGKKGVFRQGWVASTDWERTGIPEHNSIKRLAFIFRDRLLKVLRDNSLQGEEFAVASAILLGYYGEIGQDLKKGFAASGAMHILAVSGMHVGILYLFLETLLGFLKRRRYGSIVKAVLMVLMIWVYAFITGLSPPVFRAALMLSLLILGKTAGRKPDSLNVVAGSMFIMLVADPMLLFHTGFQFSYLAVTGILFLYSPIFQLIRAPGWVLSRGWSLVSLSLAAQISTFPLALYAFHQFPNYFILTNLLVLPLTSLVIYCGIGLLALNPVPVLSQWFAKGLCFFVGTLNVTVSFIEGLPGSVTTGIYPSFPDTLVLYLAIISAGCFLLTRKPAWLFPFLLVNLAASVYGLGRDVIRMDRCILTVFQVKGVSQYSFANGTQEVCLKDFAAVYREPYAQELLTTYRAAERITRSLTVPLTDRNLAPFSRYQDLSFLKRKGDYLQWNNLRIVVLSSSLPPRCTDSLHVDLVIIRGSPKITIGEINRYFSPRQIVIDPSNSWVLARNWKEEAEKLGVPCHSVLEEGAFVLNVR
ncbi:MAG: ComEC family competence protein, partial [Bacteroidetes bacterium]